MKKLLFTYCLILSLASAVAQKQANIWYFGTQAGLDFNFTPPRSITNDGLANSAEGVASIADNNGKLLFYTNGLTVVNKQQEKMKNGTGLRGDLSSTNNVVIAPLPGNDSIYYLFTTGAALEDNYDFSYNIIDMRAEGGLGEVVTKNVLIEQPVFEKIAAIRHCNNRDIWIVVRKWETDEYHAYLLTAAGLNTTPVVSHTGLVVSGYENNGIGTLKFSSKGNKLAAVHSFVNDCVELMDFNNVTGVITNPLILYPNGAGSGNISKKGVYGAEFSPNGKFLYISASNTQTEPSFLWQYDITSNNASTIASTQILIAKNTPLNAGALQLGPDLKIYMAMWKADAVSVIENPDVSGVGCNFQFNKILIQSLAKEPVQYGLPTFVQNYFDTTANPYDFSRRGNCADRDVTFKINRVSGIDSVKWDFGDGQKSQALQPINHYVNPGFYDVKLIVYKVDCSGLYDTIKRKIWVADSKEFLRKDTASCDVLKLELGIDEIFGVNYLWNTNALTSKITTTANGIYWLELEQNGCDVRDSVTLSTLPKPTVNAGNDTTICLNKPVVLKATTGSNVATTYLWSTGETTAAISVNKIGRYHVTITQNTCKASDTLEVVTGDCDIFIPNAFSPNKDGKNDLFGILGTTIYQNFAMNIYNRYGQIIFTSNSMLNKWDGTYKGKAVPVGNYAWSIIYINGLGYTKRLKGAVLVVH